MSRDDQLSPQRRDALRRLLDDDSAVVRGALITELERLGDSGLDFLRSESTTDNLERRRKILHLLDELVPNGDGIRAFTEMIRSFRYELETGHYFLERVIYPDLDTTECTLTLDRFAERCEELFIKPCEPKDMCRVLNRVLFHEEGFRPNRGTAEDPEAFLLGKVLEKLKGSGLALAILYILVGRRCQLDMELIHIPGSFLIGCFTGSIPFYIDPLERGHFIEAQSLFETLEKITKKEEEALSLMTPCPVGEILCHTCRYLEKHFRGKNNRNQADLFAFFVDEFKSAYQREQS